MAVHKGSTLSAWAAVFTLGNCAIGAGILSFPYAFRCAGLVGGVLLTLAVAVVVILTAGTVVYLAQQFRANTYQVLVCHILGPAASNALAIVTVLYLFGACVAYLIVIGETFQPLCERFLNLAPDSWLADRRTLTTLAGFLVVLPLSLNRTLGALSAASSFAIAVMAFTAGAVAVRSVQQHNSEGEPWIAPDLPLFTGWGIARAISIVLFAFQCHVQSVLIYAELTPNPLLFTFMPSGTPSVAVVVAGEGGEEEEDDDEVPHEPSPNHAKLTGMFRVISVGVAMVGSLYMLVGVFGFLAFPFTVGSNVLTSFSSDDMLIQVARAFVACAVVCHYPATHHAARAAFDDILRSILHLPATPLIPWGRLIPETILFFLTSYLIAISVDDLGVVFRLLGGTGATLLILVMPGAMLLVLALTSQSGPLWGSHLQEGGVEGGDQLAGLLHLDYDASSPRQPSPQANGGDGGGGEDPVVVVAVELGREQAGRRPVHSSSDLPVRLPGARPAHRGHRQRVGWQRVGMGVSGLLLVVLGVGVFGNTVTNIMLGL